MDYSANIVDCVLYTAYPYRIISARISSKFKARKMGRIIYWERTVHEVWSVLLNLSVSNNKIKSKQPYKWHLLKMTSTTRVKKIKCKQNNHNIWVSELKCNQNISNSCMSDFYTSVAKRA